jgi:hypothetical protein
MNSNAAAKIVDGRRLCYNTALSVEIAKLAKGPEGWREALKNYARKRGAENDFAPYLKELSPVSSEMERHIQALEIVKLIGRAVGEEVYRVHYDGNYEPLFLSFYKGFTSGEDPKGTTDGTLGDLFFECGQTGGGIASCVLPDDADTHMTRAATVMFFERFFEAFSDGVMLELE